MPASKTCFCVDGVDFLASPLYPTAIAREPKCQLVLNGWSFLESTKSQAGTFATGYLLRKPGLEPVCRNTKLTCGSCQPAACHSQGAWVQAGIWWVHWPIIHLFFILCLFKCASIRNTEIICLNDIRC